MYWAHLIELIKYARGFPKYDSIRFVYGENNGWIQNKTKQDLNPEVFFNIRSLEGKLNHWYMIAFLGINFLRQEMGAVCKEGRWAITILCFKSWNNYLAKQSLTMNERRTLDLAPADKGNDLWRDGASLKKKTKPILYLINFLADFFFRSLRAQ